MDEPVDLSPIWLTGLPLPPSSNAAYQPFKNVRSGKLSFKKSAELEAFQRQVSLYFYEYPTLITHAARKLNLWVSRCVFLDVRAIYYFEKSRIFTLQGKIKRLDIQNREKALIDGITRLLGVDDSYIFRITLEKRLALTDQPEGVNVEIAPYLLDI